MTTKELIFPQVFEGETVVGYGGDQDWFPLKHQQLAGCGSTTGANLAVYYAMHHPHLSALYKGNTTRLEKKEYVAGMEEMYRYMTPGPLGFPYVKKFAERFILYARERGCCAQAHFLCGEQDYARNLEYVSQALAQGNPIALLILRHRAPELKEDNWHWVTVTGLVEHEGELHVVFSDCGSRDLYRARVLFEPHRRNIMRMVYFTFS